MSLAIVIGSEPEHLENIEDTISVLKFAKLLVSEGNLEFPNLTLNDSSVSFDAEHITKIIDWYTGIYTLLSDPSAFPVDSNE